jgi:hypothetical protein
MDQSARSTTSVATERDVQCLTLTLLASSLEKDQTKQEAIVAETWYFLGRLDVEAPGQDLKRAVNSAFEAVNGNPRAKEIGSACDAQFETRGADLRELGE